MFRIVGSVVDIAEPESVESVPEPAPIFLLASGLAVLAIGRVGVRSHNRPISQGDNGNPIPLTSI